MELKDGAKNATREHVERALEEVKLNGVEWLFEITGRKLPRYRYSEYDGELYPTKALGYRVAQLAASNNSRTSDMTTNLANAPLLRAGMVDRQLDDAGLLEETEDRIRNSINVLARPLQQAFRSSALKLWNRRCAISGCSTIEALEAAHIMPVAAGGKEGSSNAILLRADLHRLFDLDLIAIEPSTLLVRVAPQLSLEYQSFSAKEIELPRGGPTSSAFLPRWNKFGEAL